MEIEKFVEPSAEYRPVPFLSVNDDVREDRLLWIAKEFVDKGWGGLFFHARVGLLTPYMGKRWFKLLESCTALYKEIGGRLWLYDENGWPSGQGGGQVSALRPQFRAKILKCVKAENRRPPFGTIRSERIRSGQGKLVYHFVVVTLPRGSLPDLLNPEAVREFITSTHENYKQHLGDEFGKTIPGIFTDEPQYATYHMLERESALPWTDKLPERFKEEHGYELLPNLPSLFFDVGEFRKVRFHFFSTVTRLFVESYTRQIYEWCEKNNLKYTGHYEWENSLVGQIRTIGSAMQHYEYMHYPGIDHLGRGLHDPWVEKQVSSVASQLGKERTLSETYGVSGQSLSFHDRRWIGNWQYALGINFLNHHLALYSLRGERKRDYPPTLSPHQPWWSYNKIVADHFARLSYILSQGRRVVDVLVIHPICSAWCEYRPGETRPVELIFEEFTRLTNNLLASQIDFEYGEEFLLEKYASAEGGKLRVGEARYSFVVIPTMTSLKQTTFALLKQLKKSGGKIICVGQRPSMVEGAYSEELARFLGGLPLLANTREALSSVLPRNLSPIREIKRLDGAPLSDLLVHRRRLGDERLCFVVNTNYSLPMTVSMDFEKDRPVLDLDPSTGQAYQCPERLTTEIAPGEGRIFIEGTRLEAEERAPFPKITSVRQIGGPWRILRLDPNQCVLDFARVKFGTGGWSRLLPVWKVEDEVKKRGVGCEFEIRFDFESDVRRAVGLVVEDMDRYEVYVNGKRVECDPDGWWLDPSFKRVDLPSDMIREKNQVVLRSRYDTDLPIEDIYLIGDFGVDVSGKLARLCDEPEQVPEIDDLRRWGYPFYSGRIRIEGRVEAVSERAGERDEAYLEFDELGAVVAEFELDGEPAGLALWPRYRVPVGRFLRKRPAKLAITLISSLRNLLGPRHWQADEFTGVSPLSFRDRNGWTDSYVGIPLGIKGLRLVYVAHG